MANIATGEQLALLFGVTDRRIRQLSDQGILIKLRTGDGRPIRGRYDLVTSVRAYCRYLRDLAPVEDAGQVEYREFRNRRMASEAEMAVMRLQHYKRRFHHAEDVRFLKAVLLVVIVRLLVPEARLPSSRCHQ
jgi:phage terminase Nu1 subunit (DNA packaging protein)